MAALYGLLTAGGVTSETLKKGQENYEILGVTVEAAVAGIAVTVVAMTSAAMTGKTIGATTVGTAIALIAGMGVGVGLAVTGIGIGLVCGEENTVEDQLSGQISNNVLDISGYDYL